MLSNHFPFTYGHTHGWLILVALMAIGAWIRHFFNLRHKGESKWWILGTAAAAIALLAVLIRPSGGSSAPPSATQIKDGKALFASAGCGSCHTLRDAHATGNVGPNLDALKPSRDTVANQVANGGGAMPAFKGRLTQAQIDAIAAYVASVAGR
jgi:mono/diheme cytochrome c family protein